MSNNYEDNTPNAGKLIQSLRSTGYDNYSAVADIVDNSFDAEANNIWIDIVPTKTDFTLTITDDGVGMTEEILDQAMRLGSLTDRNQESDLGKFGMGLVTASLSMSRRLKVITRNQNDTLTSIQDIDEVIEKNAFHKTLRKSSKEEEKLFEKLSKSSNTGTVVELTKLDLLQNENINQFASKLKKELGQIFRIFIDSGKNIYVRGDKVQEVDPLMLKEEETEVYSDESFEIKSNDNKETLRIRIALLPNYDSQTSKSLSIGQSNQGFYLLRNNREIAQGKTLDIFTKHNDLNRFRAEIFFSGNLDDVMGINFTKKEVKPSQSLLDKITKVAYPQIKTIRNKMKRETATSKKDDVDHNRAAKLITEKSNLLIKPKAKVEKRASKQNKSKEKKPEKEGSPRQPIKSREQLSSSQNVEFQLRQYGPNGPFFHADQAGKTTIISYNVEHPFYEALFAKQKANQDVINALDFLTYSLASAQLLTVDEGNEDVFENYFSIFSSNLRTLIK